jgi:hypothetical protein
MPFLGILKIRSIGTLSVLYSFDKEDAMAKAPKPFASPRRGIPRPSG